MDMITLKYKCPECNEEYWIEPMGGCDIHISHPCTKCGAMVTMDFVGVTRCSLQLGGTRPLGYDGRLYEMVAVKEQIIKGESG